MKIAIIEDEQHTAKDLAACIKKAEPAAHIIAMLSSVKEANDFFNEAPDLDLIFSDIQLGDGVSFTIFDQIANRTPVIFCTAFDEYALHAFKASGIDYVLKPFTTKTIAACLAKYKELKGKLSQQISSYRQVGELLSHPPEQRSLLIYHKDKITPIRLNDIALFHLKHELTHLITFDEKQYFITHSLEELEKTTAGQFYRANRQSLINRAAIRDVSQYFGRKLLVNLTIPFAEKVTVGKVKTASFLSWLSNA